MLRAEMADAKALIFDLDGTLVDTFEDLAAAVNHVRGLWGLSPMTVMEVRRQVGHGARMLIRRCVPVRDVDEKAHREFLAYYSAHLLDRTRPYPGVVETLEVLRNIPMAVLSNKPVAQTRAIVEGLGLAGFFAGVFGGGSFSVMKPDPAATMAVLAFLGVAPQAAWFVGDSEVDVEAARAAGVRVALVTTGLADATVAAALRPDLIVGNLSDLLTKADS